jgi:hypothetical protein
MTHRTFCCIVHLERVLLVLVLVHVAAISAFASYKVSPSALNFPTTLVGLKSNALTVSVKNTGTASITITSFSLSPFNTFQLDSGYTRVLSPGLLVTFGIKFVPAQAVSYTGKFVLGFSDGTSATVALSGQGDTTGAVASVSPNTINFAATAVGATVSQTVTITNTGTSRLSLNGINAQPPFGQQGFSGPVGIDAGTSFSFALTFMPTSALSYANTVALEYDVVPQMSVAVAGTGTPATLLAIASDPILPAATQQAAYLVVLNAVAGTPPYAYSVATGSNLPAGLTLSTSGTISGTLASTVTTGQYSFTVNVQDSSVPANVASLAATLSVGPPTGGQCNSITSYVPNSNDVPLVPITDLGGGTYLGVEGGLYGGGSNVRPAAHDAAGVSIAQGIGPLDVNGNRDPNGVYALIGIGVSVTRTVQNQFQPMEQADPLLHSKLKIINAAIDDTFAADWSNVHSGVWQTVLNYYLPYAGVSPKQVVAAFVLVPHPGNGPGNIFPTDLGKQESDIGNIVRNLHTYFPNLKLAYLTSPFYGGYSVSKYPEPDPYQSGFAHSAVIQDQINGDPTLNYDPAKGPVVAPWLSWGPYIWANGLNPRSDGLVWSCQDLTGDGTHPSTPAGRDKASGLIVPVFKTDDTTTPWFLNPSN